MTFKIFISSAIVSAFIAAIGNIITTKISQKAAVKAAQETANKEIEKLERTWQREDLVSSDEEFAEMAKAVAKVIDFFCVENQQDAIGKVASIRSKESGELGSILDQLYETVRKEDAQSSDALLSMAIEKKRSIKSSGRS